MLLRNLRKTVFDEPWNVHHFTTFTDTEVSIKCAIKVNNSSVKLAHETIYLCRSENGQGTENFFRVQEMKEFYMVWERFKQLWSQWVVFL